MSLATASTHTSASQEVFLHLIPAMRDFRRPDDFARSIVDYSHPGRLRAWIKFES
jgi:hypothetical protein